MASRSQHVLHDLIKDRQWDDVEAGMNTEEGREDLRRKSELYGRLPLHWACAYDAPLNLVQAMVREYPEAVSVTDSENGLHRLPLHLACQRDGVSPQIVRLLLDAYPEGARATETYGWLPLHCVARRKAPSVVLRMVVEAYPEGVTTRDNRGRLPVQLLAECASPDRKEDAEKVELLLRPLLDNEEACWTRAGYREMLLLHIAAKFDLPIEVIRSLLDTYGDAAKETCELEWDDGLYALDLLEKLRNENGTEEEKERFNEKSDLIFAYNPFIERHQTSERMRRFEHRVKIESKSGEGLSVETQKVLDWMFTASCVRPRDKRRSEHDTDGNLADGDDVPRRQRIVDVVPGGIGDDETSRAASDASRGSFRSDISTTRRSSSAHSYVSAVSDIVRTATSGDDDLMDDIVPIEREDGADSTSSGSGEERKKAIALVDLIEQQREKDVLDRLNTSYGKEEAKGISGQIVLPLHEACSRGASFKFVKALLAIYPEGAKVADDVGRLPLHCACDPLSGVPDPEVVRHLLDLYPEGAKTADSNGCLPLHSAVGIAAPADIMQMLLDGYSEAAKVKCRKNESIEALYALDILEKLRTEEDMDEETGKGLREDNHGSIACDGVGAGHMGRGGTSATTLVKAMHPFRALAAVVPFMARLRSKTRTCANRTTPAREVAKETCIYRGKDVRTLRLPEDVVAFNEKSDLLFSYNPDICPYRKDKERLQRFVSQISVEARAQELSKPSQRVWIWMCSFTNDEDHSDNYVPQINAILDSLGDRRLVERLASLETPGVRQIREIAAPKCAKAINAHFLFADRLELCRNPPMHTSATCIVIDAKDFGDPSESTDPRRGGSNLNEVKRVVVKFMSNADQFEREVSSRKVEASKRCSERSERPFLVPIIAYFDTRKRHAIDISYERDIGEHSDVFGHDLLRYPYAIVMQRAERNFDTICTHEVPSMLKIRGYMEEVATILRDLHKTGKIHADVKLLNIVRLQNMLTLIDMDAHRRINVDYCGVKFSSSILPPEMIYELKNDKEEQQFISYWMAVRDDYKLVERIANEANAEVPDAISDALSKERGVQDSRDESRLELYKNLSPTFEALFVKAGGSIDALHKDWSHLRKNEALWKKIMPRRSKSGRRFVVRAFKQGHHDGLPYALVHANPSIDIWSFGVLLYKLCTKSDLFAVNVETGDLLDGDAYCELSDWDMEAGWCDEKIHSVRNKLARDLLRWLLARDATKRPRTMGQVLDHGFFKADYTGIREKLAEEIDCLKGKLEASQNINEMQEQEWTAKTEAMQLALQEKEEELKIWTISLSSLAECSNWSALAYRVSHAPDAIPKDFLHFVCKWAPPLEVIDTILSANADLVKELNGLDDYPIHVACRFGTERCIVERFVLVHPSSMSKSNVLGRTPLDSAQTEQWTYKKSHQSEVVEFLRRKCFSDNFDDMTGFPFRMTAFEKWAHLPPPGVRSLDANGILLYIDMSGFKAVNDNVNHEAGDEAIKQYAKDITEACAQAASSANKSLQFVIDTFRMGGDEFVVVAKFAKKFASTKDVWGRTMKPLVTQLADLRFEDSRPQPRFCTFLRIGCCAGGVTQMNNLLRKAEELQKEIKEEIGLERGGFISLGKIRERNILNYSEKLVELN